MHQPVNITRRGQWCRLINLMCTFFWNLIAALFARFLLCWCEFGRRRLPNSHQHNKKWGPSMFSASQGTEWLLLAGCLRLKEFVVRSYSLHFHRLVKGGWNLGPV